MKHMADKLRMHAEQSIDAKGTLKDWGAKFVPHYFFRSYSLLHITLSSVFTRLRKERGQKINIIAPRGNAKTTWTKTAILDAITSGREKYIIIISDTGDQAEKILEAVKTELEANLKLRQQYPLACVKGGEWNTDRIETGNGVMIEALGTGKKVRGRTYKQYRPTMVVLDDPQNDEDIRSPTSRVNQMEWLVKALLPCGDPDTNFIVIGTMLHRECIVGQLEKDPAFETIRFSSILEGHWPTRMDMWDTWEQLWLGSEMKVDGNGVAKRDTSRAEAYYLTHKEELEVGAQVLWPEMEPLYALMKMRAGRHPAFASEKQNNPRDPSKATFPEEWFENTGYDQNELNLRLSREKHLTVGYGDPAKGGETKKHDYSAFVTLHVFEGESTAYVEIDMQKIPVSLWVRAIVEMYKLRKHTMIGIEDAGFQELIAENLHQEILEQKLYDFNALPMPNGGDHKNSRISRLAIWLQRKFFRFQKHCPMTAILIQQFLDFPEGDHDDGPDALEGALRLLTMASSGADNIVTEGHMSDGLGETLI